MTVLFVSPLFVLDKTQILPQIRVTAVPALPFPSHPLGACVANLNFRGIGATLPQWLQKTDKDHIGG